MKYVDKHGVPPGYYRLLISSIRLSLARAPAICRSKEQGASRGTMALGLRCRVLVSAFALLSVDATIIEAQDAMGAVAKLKTAHRPAQKDSHALLRPQGGIVTPKFQTRSTDEEGAAAPVSYVFLQKFPLEGTDDLLWHTEVLVCPREGFAPDEQEYLDQKIESLTRD